MAGLLSAALSAGCAAGDTQGGAGGADAEDRVSEARQPLVGYTPTVARQMGSCMLALSDAAWGGRFSNSGDITTYCGASLTPYQQYDNKVYVWSGPLKDDIQGVQTVVVLFRATKDWSDYYLDYESGWSFPHLNPLTKTTALGNVGNGWETRWDYYSKKVSQAVANARAQALANNKTLKVVVAGHSLGGVVSQLAGFDLAQWLVGLNATSAWVPHHVYVYAFNPPELGDDKTRREYAYAINDYEMGLRMWQFTRNKDPYVDYPGTAWGFDPDTSRDEIVDMYQPVWAPAAGDTTVGWASYFDLDYCAQLNSGAVSNSDKVKNHYLQPWYDTFNNPSSPIYVSDTQLNCMFNNDSPSGFQLQDSTGLCSGTSCAWPSTCISGGATDCAADGALAPQCRCGTLTPGMTLEADETLASCDGQYSLTMQSDGNLVLYGSSGAVWASNTAGSGGKTVELRDDGDLVLSDLAGVPVWRSNTSSGGCGTVVTVQSGLVSVSSGGATLWSSASLGCFADSSTRDLPAYQASVTSNSPAACTAQCLAAGYAYAGVQFSSQCFCGDTFGSYGTSVACTMSCNGAAGKICGGSWANNVYPTGKSLSPIGCFADSASRDLPAYQASLTRVSPAACVARCQAGGYAYAGVQDGGQCFCGNTFGSQGTSTGCTKRCNGAADQLCGGAWANNVYLTGVNRATGSLSNIGASDFSVSFVVSTTQGGTVALLNQRSICDHGMFWDARLVNGQVRMATDDGSNYTLLQTVDTVNDGRPHNVVITRIAGTLTITIDGTASASAQSLASFGSLPALAAKTDVCVGQDATVVLTGALEAASVEPYYRSCSEMLTARGGVLASGTFTIDPDGAGPVAPMSVYCDNTFDAGDGNGPGGWTLIESLSQGAGPQSTTSGPVQPSSTAAMPLAFMKALAAISGQVHLRTPQQAATQSITSIADGSPIFNLRTGGLLNNITDSQQHTGWIGPLSDASHLDFSCSPSPGTAGSTWPSLYWACNNQSGAHIQGANARWQWSGGNTALNTPFEIYVR